MIASPADIWRQRIWVWAVALAFLLLNCVGLTIYRVGYANRVNTLQVDVREQNATLERVRADEQHRRDLLRAARVNSERVQQLYDESFSTRRRRLTGVTAEVMSLANRAGLSPRTITYPEQQLQQFGLIKRSFVFSVVGSYADLRKFLGLLEQSESFLSLEEISLGEEVSRRSGPGVRTAAPPPFQLARPTPAGGPAESPASAQTAGGGPAAPGRGLTPARAPALVGGPMAAPIPPVLAPPESSSPGAPLNISMTISTLFATQDDAADALPPVGSAATQPPGQSPQSSPSRQPRKASPGPDEAAPRSPSPPTSPRGGVS